MPASFCDVVAFGAVGDGITDDTAAIAAAIVAADAGGVVYFPPRGGSDFYVHSGLTITQSLTLVGESRYGAFNNLLQYTGSGTGIVVSADAVCIEGLTFRTSTGQYHIDARGSRQLSLRDCYFTGASISQVIADGFWHTYRDCHFQGQSGATSGAMIDFTSNFNACLIDACDFRWGPSDAMDGIRINSSAMATSSGSTISNCWFEAPIAGATAVRAYSGSYGMTLVGNRWEVDGGRAFRSDAGTVGLYLAGGSCVSSTANPSPVLISIGGESTTIGSMVFAEASVGIEIAASADRTQVAPQANLGGTVGTLVSDSGSQSMIFASGSRGGLQLKECAVSMPSSRMGVRVLSAGTTLTGLDCAIRVNATGGGFTVVLPPGNAVSQGQTLYFKKIDGTGNTVTLAGNGSDTIDGSSTFPLSTPNQSLTVMSWGGNDWSVL